MDLLEFKNFSEISDLPLYPVNLLKHYDIRKSYQNLLEDIDKFIELQCKYLTIMPPKVTQDYKVVYTAHTLPDVISKNIELKFDVIDEIKLFYNQFAQSLHVLNQYEMVYFIEVLYYKRKSERQCAEMLNLSIYLLKHIKESCIIKVTRILNRAVLK